MDNENAVGSETAENVDQQLEQMRQEEIAQPEKTEQTSEGDGSQPEKTPDQRVVPLAALHEERQARKAMKQELEAMRQESARNMQVFEQRLQQMLNPPKAVPTLQDDPIASFDHRINQVAETNQQLLRQMQAERQERNNMDQIKSLANHVTSQEAQFVQRNPDYEEAVSHLKGLRVRELVTLGASEEQAVAREAQERMQAALVWAHNGQNPAEVAYNLAKVRGFQGKPSAGQKIESQQRGIASSRTLGSGGSVSNALTAEALLKMSDEDFDKLSSADWKKAMGG